MKNKFTKTLLSGFAFFLICSFVNAQSPQGLEKVIVEKYYISNEDDSVGSIGFGTLPVGSVTYRIFLDMKQGYSFKAAYGITDAFSQPLHTLYFKTTTSFFNNEDRGNTMPVYTKTQAKSNTVMLDSWLSGGAACAGNFGVLKADDDAVGTVVNSDGILQNADPNAGIPLKERDGLLLGTPGTVTIVGPQAESEVARVFDQTSQAGNSFTLTDGAWSCLNGAVGSDTTNKVLIAQITTDGDFSFELNIQLKAPNNGPREQYVAKDPIDLEILFPGLAYSSINDTTLHVGLNEIPVKGKHNTLISVFPNPTNGNFTINVKSENANSNNQLTIYNLVGKVILKKNLENTSGNFTDKVDLSTYPNGMYFVEVLIDGKKTTSKLIKK